MKNHKNIDILELDIDQKHTAFSSKELKKIMRLSSSVEKNCDENKGIFYLFLEKVNECSSEIVIVDDLLNTEISYEQLYNLIRQLELEMMKNGITQGTKVGINLDRSYKVVASILALCKIGAVIVPLDKSYPKNYILHIVNDCNLKYIISEEKDNFENEVNFITMDCLKELSMDFFEIDKKDLSQKLKEARNQINELRFIYYTSGSTGKPKGAKHTEKHVLCEFLWRSENFPLSKFDIIGQRSPINVVLSLIDMLHGILAGVKTVILPNTVLTDPEKLAEKINLYKISWVVLPASIISLISLIRAEQVEILKSLKTIITGGEVLKKSTFSMFKNKFSHVNIIDFYGCTEILSILFKKMDSTESFDSGFSKVYNLNVYILDDDNNISPLNKIGEICVSGLFTENNGYYSLGELNVQKFFDWKNPINGKIEKIYRTGDLGYLTDGGKYYILGRKDSVVKINAKFVNLKGIESKISDIPYVKSVAVVFKKINSQQQSPSLVATIVPSSSQLNKSEILEFLKSRLPDYMIPKNIYFVEDLPRLPNGKIDYKILEKESSIQNSKTVSNSIVSETLRNFIGEITKKDSDTEFSLLGLDSINATKFIFELSKKTGSHISPSEIYNYPTINKLTNYLNSLKKDASETINGSLNKITSDIAVVGMSGMFPEAENINQFWENLCNSRDTIQEIPKNRWNLNGFYDPVQGKKGCSYSKWGGFLKNIDLFDADFFNISKKEALLMDPQQRICLKESYNALIDSGWDKNKTKNIGVFIGTSNYDYKEKIDDEQIINSESVLGNDPSIIAARISYFNDFFGPALTVNTACSSSLVAVHLACQSLLLHECDMALVGGVNIINSPKFYKNTSALGVFSPTGKCKTFDDSADGFVSGEGVGFLVLKRIEDTWHDNNIYAVIKGTATNQDGKTNGITAPNGNSQVNLHSNLYKKIGIYPKDISYLETHGTGTRLGDLIELESIEKVFTQYDTPAEHKCEIGSVKTNIGHLIAAAGIAGLIKAILCVYNKTLLPSLHFSAPNKLFDWDTSHLRVTTHKKHWNGEKLTAGISSYGIGGTNAFCIIQESPTANVNKRKETIYQQFNEKSYYFGLNAITANVTQLNDDFDSCLKENFSNHNINQEFTFIENGVDSLKLIDFKNYLSEKNISVSLDDLMNKTIKQLKESIDFENKQKTDNFSDTESFSFENLDLEKLSDSELKNLLNKFS